MAITVTTSTNNRYRSIEGTIEEVIDYLDVNKIPYQKIVSQGYSGITNKIFFAVFKLSGL